MNEAFKSISSEVTNLHFRWKIFRNVYAISEEQIDLLNKIDSSFFGTVQFIYWDSIILTILRLTESKKTGKNDNLTLDRIRHDYESKLSEHINLECRKLLSSITKAKEQMRKHRSKRLAHFDYDYGIDSEAYDLEGVSRVDIETILELIREFLKGV